MVTSDIVIFPIKYNGISSELTPSKYDNMDALHGGKLIREAYSINQMVISSPSTNMIIPNIFFKVLLSPNCVQTNNQYQIELFVLDWNTWNHLALYKQWLIYACWPTIVEGDLKAFFSIATTPRYRGRCYFFPEIAPLTFDSYLIMLSVKQGGINYHFLRLWYDMTWDWTRVSGTFDGLCANKWFI